MKKKRSWNWVLVAAGLWLVGFVAYVVIGFVYFQGGTGSMAEAQRLRPWVEAMPAPAVTGGDYDANTGAIVFPNGEWVVGVAKNSHGMYSLLKGGGTVVIKDSRGRVRCFFGHVCGGGRFGQECTGAEDSLDAHDAYMAKQFAEQPWP